jgi:hypothetical protein
MGILDSIRAAFTRSPAAPDPATDPIAALVSSNPTETMETTERVMRSSDPGTVGPRMASAMATLMRGDAKPRKTSAEVLKAFGESPRFRTAIGHAAKTCGAVRWNVYAGTPDRRGHYGYVAPELTQRTAGDRHRAIARAVRDGEVKPLRTHPFLDLMERPNFYMGGRVARQMTIASYRAIGEAGWVLDDGGDAFGEAPPLNAWPVPGTWITGRPTPSDPYWQVTIGGTQWPVPVERMLMFIDPNPAQPYGRGIGLGDTLADEIDIDEHAAKMLAAYFQNRALPDAIVSLKGASPSVLQRAKREWNNLAQGFRKAYRTHWTSGEISLERLDTAFKDMQLVQLREVQRDVFQQTGGSPPEKLGIVTNSNKAVALAASMIDATDVQVPILEVCREEFQRLANIYDERLFVDYENPVPADVEARRDIIKAQPHYFRVNDVLAAAEVDGIGEDLGGEGFMVNGVWYASLKDCRPAVVPVDPLAGDGGDGGDGGETPPVDAAAATNVADTAMNGAQIASLLEIIGQVTAGTLTKPAAKAVLLVAFPTLDETEVDALLAHIEEGSAAADPEPVDAPETVVDAVAKAAEAGVVWRIRGELRSITHDDVRRILRAVTIPDMDRELSPEVRGLIASFGQDAIDAAGSGEVFDETAAPVEKAIKLFATRRVGGIINATTRAQLNDAFAEVLTAAAENAGAEHGRASAGGAEPSAAMASRGKADEIDEWYAAAGAVFDSARDTRAALIGTTETVRHGEWGTLQGLKQIDIHTQKEWITTMDGLARDSHEALDAQLREIDDAFEIPAGSLDAGARAQSPGWFGIKRQDINCRCVQGVRVVDDEKHAALVARGLVMPRGTPEEREAAWRAVDAKRAPWEKNMQSAAVAGFSAQESAVRKAIADVFGT